MDFKPLQLTYKESVEFMHRILDTMREALVVLDADLQVRAVNRAFYETFAVAPQDTLNRPLFALGNGQWDIKALRMLLQAVLHEGRSFNDFEVTHDFPTIGWKTMLLNARPLQRDATVKQPSILLVIQDITDLKRAEAELRTLQEELEERVRRRTAELAMANAELEAFAYSVSHDLRTPLRSLDGFSRALLEDYSEVLDDTGKDYLRRVCQAAQRMSQLIDDLLGLSKVARTELHYEWVDLSASARNIVEDLRAAAPDRDVSVSIQEDLIVEGDRALLGVVLRNLLGNAWKYSEPVSDAAISFGATFVDGETVFYVRDNGVGFDMKYADHLFAPFQRLHSAHEFEGNGIGLATAYRILRRHGGRIWAESEVGKGATFYFTLRHPDEMAVMPITTQALQWLPNQNDDSSSSSKTTPTTRS